MIQRNCKNCGAPIEHSYNHNCPYCGTLFDFNEPEEEIVQVRPEDMVDLKLRKIERDPLKFYIILYIEGYKLEKPKIYECNTNDMYISRVEKYYNPKKCFICIELSIFEIEEHKDEYIMYSLERTGINRRELNKLFYSVKEALSDFGYGYLFPRI